MTQKELEKYLWGAATQLRGTIDAGDYKQYIFPLLFFKRICDVYDEEFENALKESDVRKAAKDQYAANGDIVAARRLSELPQEVQNLSAPLWQVSFNDELNTRFYIDPNTGSVSRVRTDTWRLFDFMWMLHIMDYKNRTNFNTPWLVAFSGSAFLFTLTGIALLYQHFKPKKKRR